MPFVHIKVYATENGTKSSFSLPETAELVNLTGDAERVERGDARGGGLSVLHCS